LKKKQIKILFLPVLGLAVFLILIKGNLLDFIRYVQGQQAYLGSSMSKERLLIDDPAMLNAVVRSVDYEDYRRKYPDFKSAPDNVLNSKTTPQELVAYNDFLSNLSRIRANDAGRLRYQSVVELTHLVHRVFKKNQISGRKIEDGVLGRDRSRPEDYVYQLVNSKTACGTVGEATVALLRELGFKSRLVIASTTPAPIVASHILTEAYVPERNQWIMVDPMIDYTGTESVFELIGNADKARNVSNRHQYNGRIYSLRSVVWFDRKSPLRKIYYYTSQQKNFALVSGEIEKM
jgi:hypothetical protein